MENSTFSLSQLQSSRSLSNDLTNSLRQKILDGNLPPGTKLPTAKEIEEQAGVSRSVVREAIAALKAEKLIVSRQGIGVFVAAGANSRPFEIDTNEFASIEDAIQILELRMAVELEMSAMAARHRKKSHLKRLWKCISEFETKKNQGEDAVKEDLAIHLAIADASGNPYFARFIKYIGSGAIPSRDLISKYDEKSNKPEYLQQLHEEHRQLAQAIEDKDEEAAREAVRQHLGNSLKRHKALARKAIAQ
ncbi:HTH-type transcriptional regulator Mce2R [Saliniradius amylolyticus]|uniref:HTH-type transcriptional regulator Mce2R n=1 Tax=Saliniradius amylolyticus TaxID=2183582 RepID=A0A2S2E624_9ALTE|nr:FadR/GntR family transcriptional regulator [Saliniradius amylolyticus]AWL13049.1 HTH-type transcriptional regulator Mce2R [Saliniradius amylolyticus]